MTGQQKISERQAFYFTFSTGFGSIIFLHSAIIALAGRGGWVAEIAGVLLMAPLALWALFLGRQFPGYTILGILQLTTGRVIGGIVGGAYALISVAVVVLMLRLLSGLVELYVLPETPILITTLMILALSTLIADGGIEVQGRMGEVMNIVIIAIFALGVGQGFLTQSNTAFLIPVFDRGLSELGAGAYLAAGSVAEAILFLIVMVAALPEPANSCKAVIKSIFWTGILLGGVALTIIGVFGAEEAARMAYGATNVAQSLRIMEFIQGVELYIQVALVMLVILKVAAHIYACSVAVTGVFNRSYSRLLVVVIATLVAALTTRVVSYNEAYLLSILLARYVTLPFSVLALLLTSLGVLIRDAGMTGVRR